MPLFTFRIKKKKNYMAVNSKVKIRRSVYNIFTKKYGLHVQTDATKYLESLLEREDDLVDTLEKIVKAYKKRYSGKETNSAKGRGGGLMK